MKIQPPVNEETVKAIDIDGAMIAAAYGNALQAVIDNDGAGLVQGPNDIQPSGASFTIPLLLPEGVLSGDNRMVMPEQVSVRDLPLPLVWQIQTESGHDGSVIVGRIDSIEQTENGLGNAKGVFDVGPFGREAERLVRGGFLRGVSADLDKFSAAAVEVAEETNDDSDDEALTNELLVITEARLMGATLVPFPAFQECYIMIDENPSLDDGETVADGVYEDQLDDIDQELAALAASAAPVVPPRSWFTDPNLDGPTPLTVDDDGRVFGHIAAWHVDHIGYKFSQKPPRSASKYAYFRTGVLRTDDGTDVAVGQLTLAGGHAPMSANARTAVKHYDDTASAVADVTAGEDRFGIWVAGALRPDVTPNQVRALRASAPSGDWRPINGRLELVAVCQVNVPGFPTTRTMVAGGQIHSLVAAGVAPLVEMREESALSLQSIEGRLRAIEEREQRLELARQREFALAKMKPLLDAEAEEKAKLAALAASAMERMNAHLPKVEDERTVLAAAAAELQARMAAFM